MSLLGSHSTNFGSSKLQQKHHLQLQQSAEPVDQTSKHHCLLLQIHFLTKGIKAIVLFPFHLLISLSLGQMHITSSYCFSFFTSSLDFKASSPFSCTLPISHSRTPTIHKTLLPLVLNKPPDSLLIKFPLVFNETFFLCYLWLSLYSHLFPVVSGPKST